MAAIFPRSMSAPPAPAPAAPPASREAQDAVRQAVRDLLERSESFSRLSPAAREELARGLVQIGTYLAEPDGVRLPPTQQSPQVRALAGESGDSGPLEPMKQPEFGTALRTGVQQAGALMQAVNFPQFCSGLINGVFHSIVTSSIEQMEAYAKLVADVSKSLKDFRDHNTTENQGRDHLVEQFPELFELGMGGGFGDMGGFGDEGSAPAGPRVRLREGVDERAALERVNKSLPLEKPLTSLDDDVVEAALVPAARTQLATSRQQLLATLVMMGINRIVVTDGKISAKVMYDFQARDNQRYRYSATQFDHQKDAYGNVQKTYASEGTYDSSSQGGSYSRASDGSVERQDGSYYSKGDYKYSEQPIVKLMSASSLQSDSQLQARASLAGAVEVNFKSDYLPLEKLANPEAIAMIQMNAQPAMVHTLATNRPPAPGTPAPSNPAPAATPAPVAAPAR